MKKCVVFILLSLISLSPSYGQFITNDPIHTSITTLIKMFQDPSFKSIVKNIDKLQKVSSGVRQFHRGTEIINSVSRITSNLSTYSTAVAKDGHIYPAEYILMSKDIQAFAAEGNKIIKDMKSSTTQTGSVLEMTDAERVKWLNETYERVSKFEVMINNYFGGIRNMSLKRAASKNDLVATAKLYQLAFQNNTDFSQNGVTETINKNGYDAAYNENTSIPLDYLYKTEAYKKFQEKMRECEFNNQMYYKRQEIAQKNMQIVAFDELLKSGWTMQAKRSFLQSQGGANISMYNELFNATSDVEGIKSTGNNTAAVQLDITQYIEDEILAIYDPSGKRVDMEVFKMQIEHKASQLYLQNGIDKQLEKELNIQECKDMSNDFDNVMKAAEEEYKKANGIN